MTDELDIHELNRLADDAEREHAERPDEFYREGEELSVEDQALITAAWERHEAARPDNGGPRFGARITTWLDNMRPDNPTWKELREIPALIDRDAEQQRLRLLHLCADEEAVRWRSLRLAIEEVIRCAQITVHIPVLGPGFKEVVEVEHLEEALAEIFGAPKSVAVTAQDASLLIGVGTYLRLCTSQTIDLPDAATH